MELVVGDLSASAQYFTRLGIGIAIGWVPGANVVILGSWGIAAAIGSACGIYYEIHENLYHFYSLLFGWVYSKWFFTSSTIIFST